jgi:hypothetical protein
MMCRRKLHPPPTVIIRDQRIDLLAKEEIEKVFMHVYDANVC